MTRALPNSANITHCRSIVSILARSSLPRLLLILRRHLWTVALNALQTAMHVHHLVWLLTSLWNHETLVLFCQSSDHDVGLGRLGSSLHNNIVLLDHSYPILVLKLSCRLARRR